MNKEAILKIINLVDEQLSTNRDSLSENTNHEVCMMYHNKIVELERIKKMLQDYKQPVLSP